MQTGAGLKKRFGIISYISVFLVIELVFAYFILETRNIFVENSIKHGSYLAQTQVEKIETQMDGYAFCVELAGKYLDEMILMDTSEPQIQQWMKSYCEKISTQFGDNVLDIYAVVDGNIIAANPWEGDSDYDFASKSWYTDATAAPPETIVFSDLYQDAITGQNVFTMSLSLSDAANVIAIDVYLTNENWLGFSALAEGYGLLVYDPQQTLAYSVGQIDLTAVQENDILDSPFDEVSHYAGSLAENYNLYVYTLDSGWSVAISIPRENLISSNHMFLINLGLVLNALNMVITMVFLIWHIRNSRYLRHDALTGLLNKVYAIKQIRKRLKKSRGTFLIADLDNFKMLNDSYGHDHGDLIIIQVAEILQTCFRKVGCIGRFGGDEFIVYVNESLPDDRLNEMVQNVLQQVSALSQQYPLSNLAISIGGCHCEKGDKYVDVFKRADQALYTVKNSGKCGFAMSPIH